MPLVAPVWRKLVLHCSDTEDGPGLSAPAIRRYHMEHNHWQDVGYHWLVERYGDGVLWLPGRPVTTMGAHTRGHNDSALGLCVVGRFDVKAPDATVWRAAVRACSLALWTFGLGSTDLLGHRELDSGKTCPGLKWDLDSFRADVRDLLAGAGGIGRAWRADLLDLR